MLVEVSGLLEKSFEILARLQRILAKGIEGRRTEMRSVMSTTLSVEQEIVPGLLTVEETEDFDRTLATEPLPVSRDMLEAFAAAKKVKVD